MEVVFLQWSVKGSDLSTEAYGTARNSTTDIKKQMGETIETRISSLLEASEMQTQALTFNKTLYELKDYSKQINIFGR